MKALFLTLVVLGFMARAFSGEDLRWYIIELEGGEKLTARFLSEEDDSYIFNFQGSPLTLMKSRVLKINPLQGKDPVPQSPSPVSGKGGPSVEEIQDAIEALASASDDEVDRGYKILSRGVPAARPFLHEALHHQSPRVRALALKLLGEHGSAKDDLKEVAGRLSDVKGTVRLAAINALRALGPEGLPDLVKALETEREPRIRKMAVKTLQLWRDPRALSPLVARLGKESDQGVRDFIEAALTGLTRQKLGQDPEAWARYLTAEKANLELLKRLPEITSGDGKENDDGVRDAGEKKDG